MASPYLGEGWVSAALCVESRVACVQHRQRVQEGLLLCCLQLACLLHVCLQRLGSCCALLDAGPAAV